MEQIKLRLYVAGQMPKIEQAVSNLCQLCEQQFNIRCEMDIIDILEHPQLAEEDSVLTTPALVRVVPLPRRRIIGDLFDTEKVLLALELYPPDRREQT